jgi:hypothetical protein
MRLLALISVTALVAAAHAEDTTGVPAPVAPNATSAAAAPATPAPELAPATEATPATEAAPATAPEPAPPVAPAAPVAPAGAAAAATETPPPPVSESAKGNDAQHLRQPAASPNKPKSFGLQAELSAGFDSNVLLDPSNNPQATNTSSAVLSGTVKGTWRVVNQGINRLSLIGIAGIDDYPSFPKSQLLRVGAYATAQTHIGRFDPGLVIGAHEFYLDHKPAATLVTGEARVSQMTAHELVMGSAIGQYLNYNGQHEETGYLIAGNLRYWYMFNANDPRSRIEFGLRIGQYNAQRDDQTYGTVEPSVRYAQHLPGRTWLHSVGEDFSLTGDAEVRWYHAVPAGTTNEPRELRRIYTVQSAFDIWLWRFLSVGPYVSYNTRVSNIPLTGYERTQVGGRLIANW